MKHWVVDLEQKHVLYSALAVSAGFGVGIAKLVSNLVCFEVSEDQIVAELMNLVVDSIEPKVTLDDFPYYLSEKVKILLTSAGYVHLIQHQLYKHARNLSPINRAVLLSGPGEFYQQELAKALAHYFDSKILYLDMDHLSSKMHTTYGCSARELYVKRFLPSLPSVTVTLEPVTVTLEPVPGLFGYFGSLSFLYPKLHKNASTAYEPAPLKCRRSFCFDEKRFLDSLYKVLVSISETSSAILYIKHVDKIFHRSPRMYRLFRKFFEKLSGPVLILGSRTYDSKHNNKKLSKLFPSNIEIKPPQDATSLNVWNDQKEANMQKEQLKNYKNHIVEVLAANDIDCDDLNSISHDDIMLLRNHINETAASAVFYQLMGNKHPEYRNGKLIISAKSLCHVWSVFQEGESIAKDNNGTRKSKKVRLDNAYERCIRQELILANEIRVSFSDIGALDDVKQSLQEAVMLPLRRPDLFQSNGILKPCKGVLLFGPPGTGKTMLAKAIANESKASFINISSSTITSMWFGDSEKNVRALFSLAAKVAPTIIFVDEVDGLLGVRSMEEHSVVRRVKNEFMTHWDGLLSTPDEKIIVLGATNIPFSLDEAVIRRFQRRIMVGLPTAENREVILKTLLAKEKHEDIDFKELSAMTEGYSGSDLENLCSTAAYRPIKELLEQGKAKKMKRNKKLGEVEISKDASDSTEEVCIGRRPLNMEDMREAKNKVTASSAAKGSDMNRLEEWNNMYGEGGSRKKEKQEQLSYFI